MAEILATSGYKELHNDYDMHFDTIESCNAFELDGVQMMLGSLASLVISHGCVRNAPKLITHTFWLCPLRV
jgi:hypothetical protein